MTAERLPVVVVPCFNEEERLDIGSFMGLAASRRVELLFVDDGSTDGTARMLHGMAARSKAVTVLTLTANSGKAEAVRRGLLLAIRSGATTVGYFDADLATPPEELLRLVDVLEERPELAAVFGSRVARLGSRIERRAARHYLGRLYATLASIALGVAVYDTQCGAKVFRVDESLAAALVHPFRSSWALDVELLDRLLSGTSAPAVPVTAFLEVPIEVWRDVGGSKLRPGAAWGAVTTLVTCALRRRRRGNEPPTTEVRPVPSVMRPSVGTRRRTRASAIVGHPADDR